MLLSTIAAGRDDDDDDADDDYDDDSRTTLNVQISDFFITHQELLHYEHLPACVL